MEGTPMRITNSMIFGNSTNNVHRNVRHVNNLVQQIETRKLFQRPSDDPIAAARVLRYRTSLAETQQFISNIDAGLSWMHVTESAFMNMTQGILYRFNELVVEGATGHLTLDDRLALVTEMDILVRQIALEMNQTYMGRYVFSGYRTHQPPVFHRDNDLSFVITQRLNTQDIERIMSFQKFHPTHPGVVHNANVIKLAYNNVNFDFTIFDEDGISLATPGLICPAGQEFNIIVRSITDENAYLPPEGGPPFTVHFIQETGELVLCDVAAANFRNGTTVTYHRDGFRAGELNPWIYFDAIEVLGQEEQEAFVTFNRPPVDDNGRFDFSVNINEIGNITTHNLIGPDTIGPVIRINGQEFSIWDKAADPTNLNVQNTTPGNIAWDPLWETTFSIFDEFAGIDVNVIQRVTIGPDGFDFDFVVVNYGHNPVDFDLAVHINPQLVEAGNENNNLLFGGSNTSSAGDLDRIQPDNADLMRDPWISIGLSGPDRVYIRDVPAPGDSLFDPYAGGDTMGAGGFTMIWSGQSATAGMPSANNTFSTSFNVVLPATPLIPGDIINYHDDWIVHEISPGNHQRINDIAPHVYTDQMHADLRRLLDFTRSIEITDRRALETYFKSPPHNLLGQALENAIETQLYNERAQANAALHHRFSNMLYLLERHADNMIAEHARLGSRMDRFEMMEVRMEEEEINMTMLLSATADTPLQEAIMRKTAAEAAMQAALRAIAMTVQLSLVNFLR